MQADSRFLKYFQRVLADSARLSSVNDPRKEGFSLEREALSTGYLPDDVRRKLNVIAEGDCAILWWTPKLYILKSEHMRRNQTCPPVVSPVWYAFRYNRDSGLLSPSEHWPWIDRRYLEPSAGPRWTIGSLERADEFYSRSLPPERESGIDAFLAYGEDLFLSVTGCRLGEWAPPEYLIQEGGWLIAANQTASALNAMTSAFETAERLRPDWPLGYLFDTPSDDYASIPGDAAFGRRYLQHPGLHSPSLEQSQILLQWLGDNPNGACLLLEGVSGTGKSELAVHTIFELWGRTLLRGGHLTGEWQSAWIATSHAALSRLAETLNQQIVAQRWVPNLKLGLTVHGLPNQAPEIGQWFWKRNFNNQPLHCHSLTQPEVHLQATETFLSQAAKHFGSEIGSVTDARVHIAAEITRLTGVIDSYYDFQQETAKCVRELKQLEKKIGCDPGKLGLHLQNIISTQGKRSSGLNKLGEIVALFQEWSAAKPLWLKVVQKLPVGRVQVQHRNLYFFMGVNLAAPPNLDLAEDANVIEHFHLMQRHAKREIQKLREEELVVRATLNRYGELRKRRDAFEVEHPMLSSTRPVEQKELWLDDEIRKKLSTWVLRLSEAIWLGGDPTNWQVMAPMFLTTPQLLPRYTGEQLSSFEWLICDASQLQREVGLSSALFAKRLLAIGASDALPPLVTLPDSIDQADAQKSGLVLDERSLASHGSLFSYLTARHTPSQVRTLSKQLRSVQPLAEFCRNGQSNASGGRPAIGPCFGFGHVFGAVLQDAGGWSNPIEAEVIVDWIAGNRRQWEQRQAKPVSHLLAILTPFAHQARLLKEMLAHRKMDDITVSTVAGFQGNDRPWILFSPVQSSQGTPIFEQQPELLGAAVSRARDQFWVIGNLNGWMSGTKQQCARLSQFLFSPNYGQRLSHLPFPGSMSTTEMSHDRAKVSQWLEALFMSSGPVVLAAPRVDFPVMEKMGIINMIIRRANSGLNTELHCNRKLMMRPGDLNPQRVMDFCRQNGVEVFWHDGLMDQIAANHDTVIESTDCLFAGEGEHSGVFVQYPLDTAKLRYRRSTWDEKAAN